MNTFVLEIWDDESAKCTFYTVRWDDSSMSETDKFFDKFSAKRDYSFATQQLLSFILDSIGEDHGAIEPLFNRFENRVTGLPNKGNVRVSEITFFFPGFPLRLYALRINNRKDLVVLFNGGVKSAATNQQSRDLNMKWIEACRFACRIEEALRSGEIVINESRRLLTNGTNEDEILL